MKVTFEELGIKRFHWNQYCVDIKTVPVHHIDLLRINWCTQDKLTELKFPTSQLDSIIDGSTSTHPMAVAVNVDNGDVVILEGHHRLSWLKKKALEGEIDRHVPIKDVIFFKHDKKNQQVNIFQKLFNVFSRDGKKSNEEDSDE